MKYVLDTDVVIDHLRGKAPIKEEYVKPGVGISIITLAELLYGACKSKNREGSFNILSSFLKDLQLQILNLNEQIVRNYAETKVKLEISGVKLDDFDLLIASTAICNHLVLLTRNVKHFKRITGLSLAG